MKAAVIGGGASGLVAAIVLAGHGCEVSVFEHMQRVGKKLLGTGSGKCNISNTDMDISHYHSGNIGIVKAVLSDCPSDMTRRVFEKIGLQLTDRNGYLYPYSNQASAVVDVLRFAIRDLGIDVHTGTDIAGISCHGDDTDNGRRFLVETGHDKYDYDKVIICCGSNVARNTGSDGSGYDIARSFGHTVIPPLPALTYLTSKDEYYPSLAGIRTKAVISLYGSSDAGDDYELAGHEGGELQFTRTGISGIAVFNLSYLAVQSLERGGKVRACIDLLPDIEEDCINDYIRSRINAQPLRTCEELFIGLLAKPLGICLCRRCGIDLKTKCRELTGNDISRLGGLAKNFATDIDGHGGYDQAQVAMGGVSLDEVTEHLESRLVPGLYFAGEILDVNGDCGGYNLQWAASSAMCAAIHMAGE